MVGLGLASSVNVSVCVLLEAVTLGCLAAAAAAMPGSSSQPAGCNVTGFVLKTKQLPRALSRPDAALLYTLQNEDTAHLQATPDVAATAAACNRTEECNVYK